jgi:hypothetical protein
MRVEKERGVGVAFLKIVLGWRVVTDHSADETEAKKSTRAANGV